MITEPAHLYNFPSHPYYTAFRASIKSNATKQAWTNYLHNYMTYHKMKGYAELVGAEGGEQNSKLIQGKIIDYINWKQEKQGVKSQTLRNHLSALHHFYWINEIDGIKWDRIRAFLKEPQKVADDKAYTHEQIAKALEFADYRMRIIILLQASSGIRIGAVADNYNKDHYMKWGELTFIPRHGIYSIKVYPGTPSEYITFTTPECAKAIDNYINYRRQKGEIITAASPLIREQFDPNEDIKSKIKPKATDPTKPRPMPQRTLVNILRKVFQNANLRQLEKGNKHNRKENMLTHGLRKFAKKQMRKAGLDYLVIEYLIGHQSGDLKMGVTKLMMTYDPAEDGELLSEYLKAIPNLTISSVERERFAKEQAMKERDVVNEKYEKELLAQRQELESHKETIAMLVEAQKEREELEKNKDKLV